MKDYKDYKNKIEELQNDNYSILGLEIVYELESRIEKNYTDEKLNKMLSVIQNAYLKSDDTELWKITKVVVDNFDEIDDLSSWDIVEKSCWL